MDSEVLEGYQHTIVARYRALQPAVKHVSTAVAEFMTESGSSEMHAVFDIDDTLIFDDQRNTPNVQVKHLLDVARANGCKIHLVTARKKSNAVINWTRAELKRHGIVYHTLALAPEKERASMATVAAWKHAERMKHRPVALSVGDQWGDVILIHEEKDIARLDKVHRTAEAPWIVLEPKDDITVIGLKLMA